MARVAQGLWLTGAACVAPAGSVHVTELGAPLIWTEIAPATTSASTEPLAVSTVAELAPLGSTPATRKPPCSWNAAPTNSPCASVDVGEQKTTWPPPGADGPRERPG